MRNKITVFVFGLLFASIIGCAKPVHKDWFAMGGSKSDATVKLGVSWNPNTEQPETSRQQADSLAAQKCRTWGYEGAEAFGSVNQHCTNLQYTGYGPICYQMQAEVQYQCTGSIAPAAPVPSPATGKQIK